MSILKTILRHGPVLAIAVSLFSMTGCATNRQVTKDSFIQPSGFLGDYSQMQLGLPDRANLVYLSYSANWAKYNKIWIKPIELWKSDDPNSPMGKIAPDNRQTLIDLLNTSLVNALSTNYTLVDQGGSGVLIIHAAITDASKARPVAGVVSGVYLPLKLVSLGKQGLTGTGIGIGAVTIEAELLDGQSGQRLAAVLDSRSGTTALRGRFIGTWGDVENSFDWWAQRLAARLQEEKTSVSIKTPL